LALEAMDTLCMGGILSYVEVGGGAWNALRLII
jgi:hypothetical protein